MCYFECGEHTTNMAASERIEHLKTVLAQDPNNTFAHYALGMEYSSGGDLDGALAEFSALVGIDPNYANAYFMAAQAASRDPQRADETRKWLNDGIEAARRCGNHHAESEMQQMLDDME